MIFIKMIVDDRSGQLPLTVDKPNFQFVFEWLLTEDELLGEGVEQLRAAEWVTRQFPAYSLSSPSSPPPLAPLSMYSLVLSLPRLSSQFTLLAISSPPLPPPTQLLSFTCFNSRPKSLSSYRLRAWTLFCQSTSKFASWRPLLRPHFFVSSPLKQISRSSKTKPWQWGESRPGKEIVLITAENGKQSEMSRPVLTILKYYKLQLQMSRPEQQCPQYSLTSTNDLIQTLTSTRMRADTLYIILVWFHSGIRACNIWSQKCNSTSSVWS